MLEKSSRKLCAWFEGLGPGTLVSDGRGSPRGEIGPEYIVARVVARSER